MSPAQKNSHHHAVLLTALGVALLILMVMVANVARLGGAIAGEISRAQGDYLSTVSTGAAAEQNALRLGQCLRREMLKAARSGFVHRDTWAVATRVSAMPACSRDLAPLPLHPAVNQLAAHRMDADSPAVRSNKRASVLLTQAPAVR